MTRLHPVLNSVPSTEHDLQRPQVNDTSIAVSNTVFHAASGDLVWKQPGSTVTVTYSLVADGKHKLVKADPTSRTRCAPPPAAARPPATGPMQTLTCHNMTMGEFAGQLLRMDSRYFQLPVLDETGIEGRWDFTLSFAPPGLAQLTSSVGGLQSAPGGVGASDPTGVMTLEEAVDRQMGLKLRARQRPGRVLVVDYVEDTPTPIR